MRRRIALFLIAIAGIIQAADKGTAPATLIRDAENLAYFEGFEPAKVMLERAVRTARGMGDVQTTAMALDRLGSVLDFTGDTTAGAARHSEALALAANDRLTSASIKASIGLAHWRQSKYADALSVLHDALAIQTEAGDAAGAGRTLVFIGRVHFKKAEYDTAKDHYTRAHRLLTSVGDLRWVSIVLEDIGDLAIERGFFVEGLERFQEALAARTATGDVGGEIYMLTAIGRVYLQQGAFRESLTWLDKAVRLSQTVDAKPSRALALYHRGIAYEHLGDPAKAIELYSEALAIKEHLGDRRQQAWILGRMGEAQAALRNPQAALDAYRRSIRISEDIQDPRGMASGLSKAASMSLALGNHEQSLASFSRSRELLAATQPAFAASAVSGMARAYAAAGRAEPALIQARRAVEMARSGPDDVRWASLRTLGSIERRFGHREAALVHLRESLGIIESMRARVVPSADVRADFLEGKQGAYAEAVELLVEIGRADEALEIAERARARAFLDMLSARDTISAQALTLAEMRAEIGRRDATVVEFFSTPDRLYTWVVQPDGRVQATSTKISRRELTEMVGALRGSLATSQDVRVQLRQLHFALIEPVAHLLPSNPDRLVTVVPHGPLFLMSFAALLDADGRYLVERHTLSYSASISVLRHTGRNRDRMAAATHRLLAIGNPSMPELPGDQPRLDPLPGAEQEATAIARFYPREQVTTLTGSTAQERTVRELAPAQTIIHLATHAVIFDDEPMASYLALAAGSAMGGPSSAGDGFLTVGEIFGLDLHADLVALSACDTGLGRISGEGVVGLSGAFIYAGAASVLVSLWPVADVVARTEMELFYRDLTHKSMGKAAALAAAQREIILQLREGRIVSPRGRALEEHPVFWAPFVLLGEAR